MLTRGALWRASIGRHEAFSTRILHSARSRQYASAAVLQAVDTLESGFVADEAYVLEAQRHNEARTPATTLDRYDWRLRATSRIPRKPDDGRGPDPLRRTEPQREHVRPGHPYYDAILEYQERFLPLLEAEQREQETEYMQRVATWPEARLKEEGYCLTGLSAWWVDEQARSSSFGRRRVAAFQVGPGIALPENRFTTGTEIRLSRLDPIREGAALRGSVVRQTEHAVCVSFLADDVARGDMEDLLKEGTWRMDLACSDVAYRRMREAISSLHLDPEEQEDADVQEGWEVVLRGTHLRDVILGEEKDTEGADISRGSAFDADQRIASWARRHEGKDAVKAEGDPVLEGLNATQVRAMAMMIGRRVSLVQGPPGTGKTKTIIRTVKLLKEHFEVHVPLLVCTYTNAAVDNLVEGFAKAGVRPLRVAHSGGGGAGGKVRSTVHEYTWEHRLANHPLAPALEAALRDEDGVQGRLHMLEDQLEKVDEDGKKADRLRRDVVMLKRRSTAIKAKMFHLKKRIAKDIVDDSDVICTTCLTSASAVLAGVDFPVVFLDEASMSTEPASLIPLMKGSRHVALIGDHKQLPPVIISTEGRELGLNKSLFERLIERGDIPSIMLDVQYRMHPGISRFPSAEFYSDGLRDGTVDLEGAISSCLRPPKSRHLQGKIEERPSVIFLDHAGTESMKDRSRVNHNEAHIVASVVEDLLLWNPELGGESIGIIAPYVAQISLLQRMFQTDKKYRQRFEEVLGEQRAEEVRRMEIKTVDGFEGREKEVIIFSTVRNNAGGHVGFLADRRRLNVGLTRAKRGLFVVGSISTLGHEDTWRRYTAFLREQGLIVRLAGRALEHALYGNWSGAPRMSTLR